MLATLVAAPAGAAQMICEFQTMTASDHAAMKKAARKAFAPHVVDWKSLHTCMNPGRGLTWLKGVHEPQPDGTIHEPGMTCTRQTGRWQCEVASARRLPIAIAVGERQQRFELYLPLALAVEDARRMLARTIELARKLTAQPVCGATEGAVPNPEAVYLNWEADIRKLPPDIPIEASIYEFAETTTVSIGDIEFDFDGTSGDMEARKFRCWGIPIIVT